MSNTLPLKPEAPQDSAVAASDSQLRSIFAAMSEGLVIQGRDGRVIDANPAASQILGLSRDELLGRSPHDPRWHAVRGDGSAYPGSEHPGSVVLRTGVPMRGQLMGVHDPRRGLRWISINADPIHEAGSAQPSGVVATFVDITERRALEARLADTAAELQDLYDNAPDAYHSLDADGRFLRVNATALRWMGRSADELIGKHTPGDFLDAPGRQQFQRLFEQLKTTGRVEGAEADLQTADGTRRRLSLSSTAVTDAQGQFVRSRSMAHDITELHATREALRVALRQQSAMLETDLLGIVQVRERHFIWTNPGVARIFGYGADELLGLPTRLLYASEASYEAIGAQLTSGRKEGEPLRAQLEMRRKDGQIVWIDMSSVLLSEEDGISMGLFVDISSLKRAEAKKLKIIELQAENRQVRETSQLKGAFLTNLSHELRTPLNAVLGFSQLLAMGRVGPDSPKFQHYLQQILSGGRYLEQLVVGMLDYAHLESGRLEIHTRPLDLSDLVDEVLDMLETELLARRLHTSRAIAVDAQTVVADPLRIKQVLANFLSNAIKFTPADGRIVVRALSVADNAVQVEVEDSGIGIAEADLPRLFVEFQQLSSGHTKTHDGLGLGLALSRKLIEAHGGTVGVRSQVDAGSVFHFVLPRQPLSLAPPG